MDIDFDTLIPSQVCLKSTKHLGDQVLVSGYALGGLSELSQEEFQTCSYAFKLAGEIGQFGHPPEVHSYLIEAGVIWYQILAWLPSYTMYAKSVGIDKTLLDFLVSRDNLLKSLRKFVWVLHFLQTEILEEKTLPASIRNTYSGNIWQPTVQIISSQIVTELRMITLQALTDALMGKRVELGLGCTAFAHSFAGEQSPGHMETAFQLIHRLFTHDVLPSHGDLTTGLK